MMPASREKRHRSGDRLSRSRLGDRIARRGSGRASMMFNRKRAPTIRIVQCIAIFTMLPKPTGGGPKPVFDT